MRTIGAVTMITRRLRRSVVALSAFVVASTVLASCHGLPHVHPVITGLDFPAAFTIGPTDHEIWYAERFSGEIHRRDLSNGRDTLVWKVSNVVSNGERGLLGLALHHSYPSSPYIYAYATRSFGVFGVFNQVLRIRIENGRGISEQGLVSDATSSSSVHNGGRMKFGPDGNLYVAIGEHGNAANAQTINGNQNLDGKVLRIAPDGRVPADNPFPNSYVWAYGIRNSFGFTFDPQTRALWLTDNGPDCNDEVDRIVKGGNYSWGPQATCSRTLAPPANTNQSGPAPRLQPAHFFLASAGITGAAFCWQCGLGPAFGGRLFVSFVNNGVFRKLTLNSNRTAIVGDQVVYDHPGGVLAIESRPGGPLYFSDDHAIYALTRFG